MSNQISSIGFGTDPTLLCGYALAANERLGNFDLQIENTGGKRLRLWVKEFDGVSSPSGYKDILPAPIDIVPKGTKTISLNLLSQGIGFFGTGPTTANISTVVRNPGNLRGAQIDIKASGGKRGFGFDQAFNKAAFRSPGWPSVDYSNGVSGIPAGDP